MSRRYGKPQLPRLGDSPTTTHGGSDRLTDDFFRLKGQAGGCGCSVLMMHVRRLGKRVSCTHGECVAERTVHRHRACILASLGHELSRFGSCWSYVLSFLKGRSIDT